jgi:hypothetical protein
MMAPKELFTTSSHEMLFFIESSSEFFFTVVANIKIFRIFQIVSADQNFVRGVASLPVIITVDTVHTSHFAIDFNYCPNIQKINDRHACCASSIEISGLG